LNYELKRGDYMAKLLYQGHGSYRIISEDNVVIYVDPYAGEGYEVPADLILVTHQHGDHNQLQLVTKKDSCIIIQEKEALCKGEYQSFDVKGILIRAVPAYNKNHSKEAAVGYVITMDGIKVYGSGDTSMTEEMKDLATMHLDYALLPIDGIYNMDAIEASLCAELIEVKHAIPIHMKPGELFDMEMAEKFTAKNRLIVKAGEEIEL
jgi:L-ascorbate metabolism protein UlaG (beta-lactamase superfamily)